MKERDDILIQAIKECYTEMFAKAQPMADYENLLEEAKTGKISKDEHIYDRHYLSQEEYAYIINKYLDIYNIKSEWRDHVETVEEYLKIGGSKNKYIDSYTDENGNYHTGFRSYEEVPPLKEHIYKIINKYFNDTNNTCTDEVVNKVFELIDTCKNFYKYNSDEMKFRNEMAFGTSPTCNKETVKKWWKDNYNVDIEIEDKNPLLFWEYDYYGDEIDEIMTNEYGPEWKDYWWKKYEDDKKQKNAEMKERLKKLMKQYKEKEEDDE